MQTRPQPRSASVPCGRPAERDGGGSRGRCPGSKGLAVPMHRRALSPSLSAAPASRLSDLLLLLTRLVLVIFAAGGAVQPGTAPPPWLTSPARTTGSRRCKARSRSGFAIGARRRGFARRPRSLNDRCPLRGTPSGHAACPSRQPLPCSRRRTAARSLPGRRRIRDGTGGVILYSASPRKTKIARLSRTRSSFARRPR